MEILLLWIAFSRVVIDARATNCPEIRPVVSGLIKVRQIALVNGDSSQGNKPLGYNCSIQVTRKDTGGNYRSYVFTEEGMFQVTNVAGKDGSKTFFLFP